MKPFRMDSFQVGAGKTQMNWFRSLLVGSLAFTAACASGPQKKQTDVPEVTPPAAQQPAPKPVPPPTQKSGSAESAFAAALQSYEAGDLDGARKGFEAVVEVLPQSLNAQFNLGVIAERQGRPDDARVAYEKVLLLDPAHVPAVVNLGVMYREQGRLDEAIALFERALKTPGREYDASLLNSLSITYRVAGRLDASEAAARRVLVRNKDNPGAYKNLAHVAYAREKYRLAELLAGNARKHSEKDPALYNLLGMVYLKLDDRARALVQFQKAISLDAKFTPGYLNLGALALSYRDYVGAERSFGKAAELEPGSPDATLYLAWALDGQKGRDPKKGLAAGEAFEKVLATRTDLPEAVCGAGWAYASDRAGWQKAITFLDRCKGLETTSDNDKQMIIAKVQGLENMLKTPAPEAAPATAEGEGAPADEAIGGGGAQQPAQGAEGAEGAEPGQGAEVAPEGDATGGAGAPPGQGTEAMPADDATGGAGTRPEDDAMGGSGSEPTPDGAPAGEAAGEQGAPAGE
ncbi:tetratricopeptide repeat protein [Myxococcus sp. SDU36]|uniref:tetratricopeptide repeat protein n=1 Tax=Myxococcus sp. SDU36 TaxID=2831967 RepID=UPI0025437B74|nr:tetratricopeptide repeat protein [Myxococcus sp. SDU36]WIG96965.1 tetratricopeptide repeat protein [Myxococcus sp. SDU36]